ncbi:hypothetical protein ACKKBF_B32880 [Auxenochlorella protothecoides x Auxenochlorella symbiontica]
MDFQGQRLSEKLYVAILSLSGAVAFLVGYLTQSFANMLIAFSCGVGISLLISVPDWPIYNKHPIKWLPASDAPRAEARQGGKAGSQRKQRPPSASWRNFWNLF